MSMWTLTTALTTRAVTECDLIPPDTPASTLTESSILYIDGHTDMWTGGWTNKQTDREADSSIPGP